MTKLCTIHITHAHCRHCIALESYIIYYVCELSKKVIMSLEIVFVFLQHFHTNCLQTFCNEVAVFIVIIRVVNETS